MVSESGFILSLDYVYFLDQPSFSALSGPTETENMDLIKDLFYLFDKIQRTGSHSGVQRQEVTSGCVCFFFSPNALRFGRPQFPEGLHTAISVNSWNLLG